MHQNEAQTESYTLEDLLLSQKSAHLWCEGFTMPEHFRGIAVIAGKLLSTRYRAGFVWGSRQKYYVHTHMHTDANFT